MQLVEPPEECTTVCSDGWLFQAVSCSLFDPSSSSRASSSGFSWSFETLCEEHLMKNWSGTHLSIVFVCVTIRGSPSLKINILDLN